jgi:VanZ family protein
MGLIFSASSDTGSFQHSSRIIGPLINWLFPHATAQGLYTAVIFFRKCAHLTEYAILAILVWRALSQPVRQDPRPWHWPVAVRTTLWVVLYAASDEFHQLFVPSREGAVRDVLIDTSGGILALLALWAFGNWRRRRENPTQLGNSSSP